MMAFVCEPRAGVQLPLVSDGRIHRSCLYGDQSPMVPHKISKVELNRPAPTRLFPPADSTCLLSEADR